MEDFYWLNTTSRKLLERGYLLEGVTPEQRYKQIADRAEELLGIEGFSDKFYGYMAKGYFSLSTPVVVNFGLDRGLPIACNGGYVEDSLNGIMGSLSETAILTKNGAGTSLYFGDVRGRGSAIKYNGVSNGTLPFMSMFDTMIDTVSQGQSRRGSLAIYMDVDHKDIEEFLAIKDDHHDIQSLFPGVCVPSDWLQEMRDGDKPKQKVWRKIIKSRSEKGLPYLFFSDNVNQQKPRVYTDFDMPIYASNLCITGDQRVVSNKGLITAKELFENEEELTLFDGQTAVKSSPMLLRNKSADILEIVYKNGMTQKVTKEHNVPVRVKHWRGTKYELRPASTLEVGNEVPVQKNKGLFGTTSMEDEAFLLGHYHGDGTQVESSTHICLWEDSFDLEEEIQLKSDSAFIKYKNGEYSQWQTKPFSDRYTKANTFTEVHATQGGVRKRVLMSTTLRHGLNFRKATLPRWIWTGTEQTQWEYIRGLFYTDGTVNHNKKATAMYLSVTNTNKRYLQDVMLILRNLGLDASLHAGSEERMQTLPDGKGGTKEYLCKESFRLVIGNKPDALLFEKHTGFLTRKGVVIEDRNYRDNTKKFTKIVEINELPAEPVYCPTVSSDEHIFISQGVKTGNCSEIFLPSSPTETFVCCLASMNLLHYQEFKDTDAVYTLTQFLDAVMEEYIQKTNSIPHLEKANKFARRHRALGLGVLGWHSLLQKEMIPFGDLRAMGLTDEIFKYIKSETYRASEDLAKLLGEPELLKGYGRRNTTTMAIAPTSSSSVILGQVSQGIEPVFSNYYTAMKAHVEYTHKNQFLKELLKSKGQDTRETWKSIMLFNGSVQHLPFLDQEEKDVFKTFQEISQMDVLNQAAIRQKYIDQGQSLNLMIHPKTPTKDLNKLLLHAHDSGLKGLYYQHSFSAAQEFNRDLINCTACES